jgi:hypothetical protein
MPTHDDLQAHLDYWRPRICPEWRVAFLWEVPDCNARMEVTRATDYLDATIKVKPIEEWRVDPEEGGVERAAEATVVHEFVHCVLHDVEFSHAMVERHMHREAWLVQERAFIHDLERAVDRIAHALVSERHATT